MEIINKTGIEDLTVLMEDVLRRIKNKDKYDLNGDIILEEYDVSRVYFTVNDKENTLRIWDTIPYGKYMKFRWSLFVGNNCVREGVTKIA